VEKAIVGGHLEEFGGFLKKGIEHLLQACKIYVEDIKNCPELKTVYQEKFPEITNGMWAKYEKIGKGIISARLLIPPRNANFIQRFSIEEQERCLSMPIEVLLLGGGETLKVSLENLTSLQCRQVFAYDHVRTLSEQRALIESEKTQGVIVHAKKVREKYSIVKDVVKIHSACTFTRKELERILLQEFK
jgi:hypothetical protein